MRFLKLLVLVIAIVGVSSSEPVDSIINVASSGLNSYLAGVVVNDQVAYNLGLPKNWQSDKITLGDPIKINRIDVNDSLTPKRTADILTDIDQYFVPVKFNNSAKLMIIVAKMNGIWQRVSIGYNNLAVKLDTIPIIRNNGQFEIGMYTPAQKYALYFPQAGSDNLTLVNFGKDRSESDTKINSLNKTLELLKTMGK